MPTSRRRTSTSTRLTARGTARTSTQAVGHCPPRSRLRARRCQTPRSATSPTRGEVVLSRLTVLLTTPRLPAGLLTGPAWRVVFSADRVLARDLTSPLSQAVRDAGVAVEIAGVPTATDLTALAADADIVWLAADDGDPVLTADLADHVVRTADSPAEDADVTTGGARSPAAPDIEILLGSYDPPGARVLDLVAVMDRLRRECPWDQEQTHTSLVRYLLEEAYETVEAIETGDRGHLREELGDVLLQVMFRSRIAEEHPDEPF